MGRERVRDGAQISSYVLGGVGVRAVTFAQAVDLIIEAGRGRHPARFHFCSANTIVEATADPVLRAALNEADFVLPDGFPVAWYGWVRGNLVERACGPDVMLAVLDRGRRSGARHYFYGGGDGVAPQLVARLTRLMPDLTVAGYETPPYLDRAAEPDRETVERINRARPTHVWVGLGSPKQDLWLAAHASRLECGALLAVGAAFDFHAALRQRAPRWMQKSGTEWFHRLATEPRRLWRRYTVTNARFVGLLARDLLAPSSVSDRYRPNQRDARGMSEWTRISRPESGGLLDR